MLKMGPVEDSSVIFLAQVCIHASHMKASCGCLGDTERKTTPFFSSKALALQWGKHTCTKKK